VYFDTSKFPDYGKLGKINLAGQREGARVEMKSEKKNPTDFLLWKSSEKIGWDSPWGKGFPGWHIECSAMIRKILGDQIDIHTGGIEHIGVHHQNEIAQSESATGKKPFVRYWLHRAHLQIDDSKIAKSGGNVVYLEDIAEKNIAPLAFRYFLLGSHYSTPTNFTWDALESAQNAYRKLKDFISSAPTDGKINNGYKKEFENAINNDLNSSEALAVIWKLLKDETVSTGDKRATILDFDKVLGLNLENNEFELKDIPKEVRALLDEREIARSSKDWDKADKIRKDIENLGYKMEDKNICRTRKGDGSRALAG